MAKSSSKGKMSKTCKVNWSDIDGASPKPKRLYLGKQNRTDSFVVVAIVVIFVVVVVLFVAMICSHGYGCTLISLGGKEAFQQKTDFF